MHFTLVGLLLLAFWLYCVLDVVMAEASLVRNLPKLVWLVFVVLVPTVGGVAWLIAGRPAQATLRPGSTERRRPWVAPSDHPSMGPVRRPGAPRKAPPRGPDDDPDFLRRLDEELGKGGDGPR